MDCDFRILDPPSTHLNSPSARRFDSPLRFRNSLLSNLLSSSAFSSAPIGDCDSYGSLFPSAFCTICHFWASPL
ncbi:hypothetical protein EUGRSUZ_J00021 [Eucalyptus grandis]|uniref:Uncharacterized protein n=2 Tax=Eucalyptus grandis TaxID=71139 RepID=A0ACC3J189_EUCGR|nr:hypothetical protein EUGRSUZ_J00021 [Eucalyptus grandis]